MEVLARAIRQEKEIEQKEIKTVKLSLFGDDVILFTENPNESTKKLLELINKFSKIAVYKVNNWYNSYGKQYRSPSKNKTTI